MGIISDLKSSLIEWNLIIAVDGLNPKFHSKTHKKRFSSYLKDIGDASVGSSIICQNPEWGHLSGNLNNVLNTFKSSAFTLVVQDDLLFIRDVPLYEIMNAMVKNPALKHIRFNRRQNMVEGLDTKLKELKFNGVQFTKTNNWSDNNHLVKTDYYAKYVFPNMEDLKTYPENRLRVLNEKYPNKYGTYIYGGIGSPNVIKHIGETKSRTRAQMVKIESGSIFLSIFIRFILRIHDFVKKIKI